MFVFFYKVKAVFKKISPTVYVLAIVGNLKNESRPLDGRGRATVSIKAVALSCSWEQSDELCPFAQADRDATGSSIRADRIERRL